MTRSTAANLEFDWTTRAANTNDVHLAAAYGSLREEIAEMEGVVSAAFVVTTAFRMKDERGMIEALRSLSEAMTALEARREGEG